MSAKVKLSFACGDYEIFRPLFDGTVKADGIDLVMLTISSRERHWRMARHLEFDICEFNVGAYINAKFREMPITAIPVFGHRRFRHGFAFVNTKAGIRTPKDLIGKRVGGTNFQPAANIWLRGILEEHYGVPHKEITWVVERDEDVPFTPQPGLRIEKIPEGGKSLEDRFLDGEIPAMIQPGIPKSFIKGDPRIARLFPDYKQVEIDYYKKTGIFPIMHITAIKQEIVDKYPWVPINLMKAFDEAKAIAYKRTANPRSIPIAWARTAWEEERSILGPDPWEYGLTPKNRTTLETIARYVHQQGLTGRRMTLDELFVDVDLSGMGPPEEGV